MKAKNRTSGTSRTYKIESMIVHQKFPPTKVEVSQDAGGLVLEDTKYVQLTGAQTWVLVVNQDKAINYGNETRITEHDVIRDEHNKDMT